MVSPKTRRFYKNFTKNCIFIVNECKVDHFYVVQSFWGGEGPSYLHGRHAPGALLALLWPTVAEGQEGQIHPRGNYKH